MASRRIAGSFTATGNSDGVSCNKAIIDVTHSGTATVNLQWQVDGTNWRTIEAYTASTQKVFESNVSVPIRLNCSAYTNSVAYAILTE
jgi:hypothetical protein